MALVAWTKHFLVQSRTHLVTLILCWYIIHCELAFQNCETVTDLRGLEEDQTLYGVMKGFIAFVLCLAFANGHILHTEYEQQWQAWKTFYEKKYSTDTEEEARYAIWRDNLRVS